MKLKQSTTTTIRLGPFVDKTDGVSPETGLAGSMTVYVSKSGGAFAARSSATAPVHDRDGWYSVELNATDTNTPGELIVQVTDAATHLPVFARYEIVPANVYDSLVTGSDRLEADLVQVEGVSNVDGAPIIGFFRVVAAVLWGKVSGAGTNAPVFRSVNDTKNRVSTTGDANGNRSAVSVDYS